MTIARDSVDEELVSRPQRWDIHFIRNFMLTFGTLSSAFDFLTFLVLMFVFRANVEHFRTAWFLQPVVSATLVVLIVRTRRLVQRSAPSKLLVFGRRTRMSNLLLGGLLRRQQPLERRGIERFSFQQFARHRLELVAMVREDLLGFPAGGVEQLLDLLVDQLRRVGTCLPQVAVRVGVSAHHQYGPDTITVFEHVRKNGRVVAEHKTIDHNSLGKHLDGIEKAVKEMESCSGSF